MADPFRHNAKPQLLRDAQVGLSIVAILLVLLVYVTFYRITGRGKHIPAHVQNAPVAQIVWPQNGQLIAANEIEMTAQEFRDTRLPKPPLAFADSRVAAAGPTVLLKRPDTPDRADSVARNKFAAPKLDSPSRSAYQAPPLSTAMAETKTSRPNSRLKQPNFSPNKPEAAKKIVPPAVQDPTVEIPLKPVLASDFPFVTPSKLKAPEPIGFHGTKADVPTIDPMASAKNSTETTETVESSIAIKQPAKLPVNPFEIEIEQSKIDPKVELASLERGGNDFQGNLLMPKIASPEPAPKLDVNSKEFQPARLLSKDSQDSQSRGSDFVGLENFNTLRPKSKDPFNEILDSAPTLDPAPTTEQPSLSPVPESTNTASGAPLLEPVMDPSKPAFGKRLPRLSPESETKIEKKQTKKQADKRFRESKLSELEYVTKAGDNFWSIAQAVYQDGRYFRALYKYNEPKVPNFDSLEPGTIIGTPALEDLVKLWPDLCPGSQTDQFTAHQEMPKPDTGGIYITQTGDTLFDIARQRLGQASRYSEILNLNQVGLGNEVSHLTPLQAGVRIVLPQ